MLYHEADPSDIDILKIITIIVILVERHSFREGGREREKRNTQILTTGLHPKGF